MQAPCVRKEEGLENVFMSEEIALQKLRELIQGSNGAIILNHNCYEEDTLSLGASCSMSGLRQRCECATRQPRPRRRRPSPRGLVRRPWPQRGYPWRYLFGIAHRCNL